MASAEELLDQAERNKRLVIDQERMLLIQKKEKDEIEAERNHWKLKYQKLAAQSHAVEVEPTTAEGERLVALENLCETLRREKELVLKQKILAEKRFAADRRSYVFVIEEFSKVVPKMPQELIRELGHAFETINHTRDLK